jgi:2-isopropylmalate synthase/UPF0716 protein FxsA
VVYVFLYLFLEVMVSTSFASMLGGLLTFIEIVFTAFIGIFLLRTFQFSIMESGQKLSQGEITQDEFLASNMSKAIGAILLIIPGFFTDIIGLLLQFGILTFILIKLFSFKPKRSDEQNQYNNTHFHYESYNNYEQPKRRYDNEEIIDVEIIDDSKSIKS